LTRAELELYFLVPAYELLSRLRLSGCGEIGFAGVAIHGGVRRSENLPIHSKKALSARLADKAFDVE